MAPLAWKLLLATMASGQHCSQSESSDDQTALLQSHLASHKSTLGTSAEMLNFPKITSLTDPSQRKMALTQFENTAIELAENKAGVTPLVVQVCTETSELLRDTVMGAIISEHNTDVAMLATAYAAFDGAESERLRYEGLINEAVAAVYGPGGLIDQHIECRTWESQECVDCGECRIDCETTREECDLLEAELRLKYIDVINTVTTPAYCDENGHIHPPHEDVTITSADHHLNKEKIEAYLRALEAFEACEETESTHCTSCPENPHSCTLGIENCPCLNHTVTRTNCNTIQQSLQHAQCESRHSVSNYLQLYTQAFEGALHRYQMVESQIRIMEADRKVEWDTLERVICLLMTLSIDEDGSASSTETADAIASCRTSYVDTSHLDIEYPVPPGLGDLPDLPHSPCSDEFENDAYNGVPPGCAGNEELQHQFEHGLITECECSAEAPTPREIGFPYELGPFLLFDTGLSLMTDTNQLLSLSGTHGSFQVSEGMDAWSASFFPHGDEEPFVFRGRCSPFASVTLPNLDAAFSLGLEGDNSVSRVAWAYPDESSVYQQWLAETGQEIHYDYNPNLPNGGIPLVHPYAETQLHRFLRVGGFVYLNEAGAVVAVKELSIAPPALIVAEDAQLTLTFDAPRGITVDQANHACPGGFRPVTMQALLDGGAVDYCWDKSLTLSFCPHGCFIYNSESLEGFGYIAFPVKDSTAHLAPPHYAPTDQQGAVDVSLYTGVLAATNPPTYEGNFGELPEDGEIVCCRAMTASCLSCQAGVPIAEYCGRSPTTVGCEQILQIQPVPEPEPVMCCMAIEASCEACQAGLSIEEYCRGNPNMQGCPDAELGCCFDIGQPAPQFDSAGNLVASSILPTIYSTQANVYRAHCQIEELQGGGTGWVGGRCPESGEEVQQARDNGAFEPNFIGGNTIEPIHLRD